MYEIFEQLLNKRGITAYKVSKDTGIPQSTFSTWKNRKTNLNADNLRILANYFGVPVDYLITGKMPEEDSSYYLDDEAKELAQFMFENPEYKVLFDASRKVKKEDIEFVKEMIDRMQGNN